MALGPQALANSFFLHTWVSLIKVDPAETRTPVGRTLCKKYEAYIEIKAGIVIPVEFRIRLQFDLVSTDLPTL